MMWELTDEEASYVKLLRRKRRDEIDLTKFNLTNLKTVDTELLKKRYFEAGFVDLDNHIRESVIIELTLRLGDSFLKYE